jgi:ribonuclease PH
VALVEALWAMNKRKNIEKIPLRDSVAAISVGLVNGQIMLDLSYEEDSRADVDMNFVMTGKGLLIEVQGTAEKTPFTKEHFDTMYQYALKGISEITRQQKVMLGPQFPV